MSAKLQGKKGSLDDYTRGGNAALTFILAHEAYAMVHCKTDTTAVIY